MSFNDRLAKTKAAIEAVLAKGEDNLDASDIEKLKGLNAEAHELQDSIETLDTVHKRFEGLTDNLTNTQKSGAASYESLGDFVVKSIGEQLVKMKGVSGASIAAPEWLPNRKANTDTQVTGGPSGAYGSLLTYVDPNFVEATAVRPSPTSSVSARSADRPSHTSWKVSRKVILLPSVKAMNSARFIMPTRLSIPIPCPPSLASSRSLVT